MSPTIWHSEKGHTEMAEEWVAVRACEVGAEDRDPRELSGQ